MLLEHACGAPAQGHGPDNPYNYAQIEDYLKRRAESGAIDDLEVRWAPTGTSHSTQGGVLLYRA